MLTKMKKKKINTQTHTNQNNNQNENERGKIKDVLHSSLRLRFLKYEEKKKKPIRNNRRLK